MFLYHVCSPPLATESNIRIEFSQVIMSFPDEEGRIRFYLIANMERINGCESGIGGGLHC